MTADLLCFVCSSPECREDAVSPVISGDVKTTEHLRRCDRLRVHPHLLVYGAALGQSLHQHVDTGRLTCPGRTESHHTVTDELRLVQLNQLQYPRSVSHQTELTHLNTTSIERSTTAVYRTKRKYAQFVGLSLIHSSCTCWIDSIGCDKIKRYL